MNTTMIGAGRTSLWRHRLIVAAPLLGALALWIGSNTEDAPTLCPFALCTGTACPGCGMTRALTSLAQGDLGRALTFHPLVVLVAVQLAVGWGWYLLIGSGRARPIAPRTLDLVLIGNALALVLVWVIRLLSGTLPPV